MPNEKQSFRELLGSAPLAVNEDSITLTGALERSQNPERFVLVLANGRTVVLDVSAVKAYRVIGGMIGQMLVEVDVARAQVPPEIKEDGSTYLTRFRKSPALEKGSWEEPFHPGNFGNWEPVPLPWFYNSPYAGIAPFALATRHQAPPNAIAAMSTPALLAGYANVSHPIAEGTRPGFPYGDF